MLLTELTILAIIVIISNVFKNVIFKNTGLQNDFVLEGEQRGNDNMSKWRVIISVLMCYLF